MSMASWIDPDLRNLAIASWFFRAAAALGCLALFGAFTGGTFYTFVWAFARAASACCPMPAR